MATQRLGSVLGHLSPNSNGLAEVYVTCLIERAFLTLNRLQKNPDDIVITLALRTPLARGFKGGFKDTDFASIVYELLKTVREKAKFDPRLVDDICIGNVSIISYLDVMIG